MSLCGASATPSTQNKAPGTVEWIVVARALMSWIPPRMLEAWVQVTRAVLGVRRGRRVEGVRSRLFLFLLSSLSFLLLVLWVVSGFHHFTVWFCKAARRSQGEMLVSWSIWEIISSERGGRERIWERLEKSWVVEGPITVVIFR